MSRVLEVYCPDCGKKMSGRSAELSDQRNGRCAKCDRLSRLKPYDEAAIIAYIARWRRAGGTKWDRILSDVRANFHPPPFARWYARKGEWHTLDIHDFATRSWGWAA